MFKINSHINMKKGFIVPLVIVIIALLAIGGGAYVYTKNKSSKNSDSANTQATSTIQTADWKTYTNNEFGFQVKYPANLEVKETSLSAESKYITISPIGYIGDGAPIFVIKGGKDIQSYESYKKQIQSLIISEKNVTIDNVSAKRIHANSEIGGTMDSIFLAHNGNNFSITMNSFTEQEQILSTFKFISSQATQSPSSVENIQPFNWYGKYEFGEVASSNPGGGSVQSWQYNLSISSSNGASRWIVGLDVDGFQTMTRINATANNVGNSLDIIFDSNEPNTTLGGYKKGDVLFTLTPATTGLLIQWKKMQPNVQASLNGSVFTKPSNQISTISQSTCLGKNDPYYNLGFGIEHEYNGNIQSNMPVNIVLSCDHKTFTITGSINQIITSRDTVDSSYKGEISELADLVSGTEVVKVNTDYNFDGYNDLSTINSNGSGVNQVDGYYIFLYNPSLKKFVYNKELSQIENVYVPEGSKNEVASSAYYINGYKTTFYTWSQGKLIESRKTVTCVDKSRDPRDLDGICK